MLATLVLAAVVVTSAAERPRVCLALSGGGARGLAHIGVLQALEAGGVPIQCVAGTSMGAMVGGFYAAGYSPSEMEAIVRSLEWQDVFSGKPERRLVPLAFRVEDTPPVFRLALEGRRVRLPRTQDSDYRTNRLLFRLLAERAFRAGSDFDDLRVPFRAVATDLESGQRVVLGHGSLTRAVRASLSTPVKLLAVRIENRLLVDGGLVDNLPVGVARELGADLVVAVDARSPAIRPRPTDSFVDTTAVLVDVLMRARNAQHAVPADVEIDLGPALAGLRETEYTRHAEAVEIGRRHGREGAARALALHAGGGPARARDAASGDGPAHGNGGHHTDRRELEGSLVREVVVHGNGRVREGVVRRAFDLEPGRPFLMKEALRGMDEVYATRLFESVWLDAAPVPGVGTRVTVEVQEAPRLILEAGGGYNEGDKAKGFLRLRSRNLLGRGERSDTTLLASDSEVGVRSSFTAERPLGLPVGIFTRGHVVEEKPPFFIGDERAGRAEFDREGLAAGLQHRLGPSGLVRVGLARATVRTRETPKVPFLGQRDRLATLLGEAAWDNLDDRALPTKGTAASVFVERSLDGLRASRRYWRGLARVQGAVAPHSRLVLRGQVLGFLSGRDLPVYEQVRLGGPHWMPGFHREQIWGPQALAGSVTVGVGVYRALRLVARAGAGNVWDTRPEVRLGDLQGGIGLGLELPTRAGPVVLDWGRSRAGTSRFHVSLGFPWAHSLTP